MTQITGDDAPHAGAEASLSAAVPRKAAGRLAEARIVLCGKYSSTCRRILEYSPQSTPAESARRRALPGKPRASRPPPAQGKPRPTPV